MRNNFINLLGLGAVCMSLLGCSDEGSPISGMDGSADAGPSIDAAPTADSSADMTMQGADGANSMGLVDGSFDATLLDADSQVDGAETAAVCVPACTSTQVCCTDSHGHNPACVEGTSCP